MKKIFAVIAAVVLLALFCLFTAEVFGILSPFYKLEKKGEGTFLGSVWYFLHRVFKGISENKVVYYLKNTSFYQDAVIASKAFDKATGMNCTTSLAGTKNVANDMEDVVLKLSDGSLVAVMDDCKIEAQIDKALELNEYLKSLGIGFVYLAIPDKIDTSDSGYLSYLGTYPDFTAESGEMIEKALNDAGIPIARMEGNVEYFKTDIHWLPETGLIACKGIADVLNSKFGYDLEKSVFDLNNYELERSVDILGPLGKKVTHVYCDTEPFFIMKPKFETNLTVSIQNKMSNKTGTVEETLFDYSQINEELYSTNKYDMYAHGNPGLITIHNNLVDDGTHLMVVKTSMANVVTPYLATQVEDMDIVDVRYYKQSIKALIEKRKPDVVIMIYGTSSFKSEALFEFR